MLFNSPRHTYPVSLSIYETMVSTKTQIYPRKNKPFFLLLENRFPWTSSYGISTIWQYLPVDATRTLVVSLVLSQIDCCIFCNFLLAGLPLSLACKLQTVQTCAACLVVCALPVYTSNQYSDSSTGYPSKLAFLTKLLASVSMPSTPPLPLVSLISYNLFSPSQSLRSSADTCLLKLPQCRCKTKGEQQACSYFGPSVWNSLPPHTRNATTINSFKTIS